jgi:hypothetical protein
VKNKVDKGGNRLKREKTSKKLAISTCLYKNPQKQKWFLAGSKQANHFAPFLEKKGYLEERHIL